MVSRKRKLAAAAGAIAVLGALAAGASAGAVGSDSDGKDVPITGEALDKATKAALDHVREGRVTETEVGDEEGFYEVEITLSDGTEVDVHLDEDFKVLGTEADESPDDDRSEGL